MQPPGKASYIAIARIVRSRGNRGEVLAEYHTDHPARFRLLEEVWLVFEDQSRRRMRLENFWEHRGRAVLKFAGIDSISDAERLKGAWVQIEAEQALPLPEGTYYDHDLKGCTVRTLDGIEIGEVRDLIRCPGNHLLVVACPDREILIPASEGICKEVSIDEREILVDLPDGLMDLNE